MSRNEGVDSDNCICPFICRQTANESALAPSFQAFVVGRRASLKGGLPGTPEVNARDNTQITFGDGKKVS